MENVNMNEKANINDELMEDISGGMLPGSLDYSRCAVCGKLTANVNLVDHHRNKVCKSCMKTISNK